jgi:hypothetical protein
MSRSLFLAVAVAVALAGCDVPRDDLVFVPPHTLAVGSFHRVHVSVPYASDIPGSEPPRLTAVWCEGAPCETTIEPTVGPHAVFTVRALGPGETMVHVTAERSGDRFHVARDGAFFTADRLELRVLRRAPIREGIGVLVGSTLRWGFEARARGLRNPLIVTEDDASVELGGTAFVRSPSPPRFVGDAPDETELIARRPGVGHLTVRAAGVAREVTFRAAGEDEVARVELLPEEAVRDALASDAAILALRRNDDVPIASERLVPVLVLRDGSLAIGGEGRVAFDPPELVRIERSEGLVRLRGEGHGRGRLRFQVGDAALEVERDVAPSPYY